MRLMKLTHLAVLAPLMVCTVLAQQSKTPVSVSHIGEDQFGSLFVAALNRELSQSAKYERMAGPDVNKGLRFYVELVTVDVADDRRERGKRSAASVVIEDMGLPNTFPVATKWYHKVIVVDQQTAANIAKELVEDLDARWCNTIISSVGRCPKEKLYPTK